MMKNDEKNRNIIFYFPFSQNAKKKSFDKLAQKKKKKNTNTNNPKREEEQEAFVRSFVMGGGVTRTKKGTSLKRKRRDGEGDECVSCVK